MDLDLVPVLDTDAIDRPVEVEVEIQVQGRFRVGQGAAPECTTPAEMKTAAPERRGAMSFVRLGC